MKTWGAFILIALMVVSAGCGGNGESATSADVGSESRTAIEAPQPQREADYPVPSAPPKKGRLSKLVVKNLETGFGPVARWGDEVAVRYVGLVYQTGKIYSQHWDSSLVFKLDRESFGIGWQKGIEGMRVGERREVLIPARFLLKDQDVAYVISLVRVKRRWKTRSFKQAGSFAAINVSKGDEKLRFEPPDRPAPEQLHARDLEEGSGPIARRGDRVAIRYLGAMYETGKIRHGGMTQLFRLGSDGLGDASEGEIEGEGFEESIEGMRPGGRREVVVPSRLLGGSGAGAYVIELARLEPASAP